MADGDRRLTVAAWEASAFVTPTRPPARFALAARTARHAAEPGQGYDAKAAAWRERLPRPASEPDTEQAQPRDSGG